MQNSIIIYPNLRAEMSRLNLGVVEIARRTGKNRDTLARRLSGKTKLSLVDAFDIQQSCFPNMDVKYLFAKSDHDSA